MASLKDLSDSDLEALAAGNLQKISDEGLYKLAGSEGAHEVRETGVKDMLLGAADLAGRGLDYAGGLTRTGVGSALGQYQEGDLMNALKGQAPSTSDYLDRMGMEDGMGRDFAGFVGDVALDPLTYLSGGLSAANKVGKESAVLKKLLLQNAKGGLTRAGKVANVVANPLEIMSKKAGGSVYNSAFDKADRALMTEEGKGSIADILKADRFKGGADAALERAKELNQKFGAEIGNMRKGASDVTQDIIDTVDDKDFQKMKDVINELAMSPEPAHQAEAENLKNLLNQYMVMGEKNPEQLAILKRNMTNEAGGGAMFKAMRPPVKNQEDKLRMLLTGQLNKAENSAMRTAVGDEGLDQYLKLKKDYGVTSSFGQKQLQKQANREANITGALPSAVDLLVAPAAVASGDMGKAALAAKKARDILRLTGPKTHIGLGLEDASKLIGKTKGDAAARQLWIEILRQEEAKKQK